MRVHVAPPSTVVAVISPFAEPPDQRSCCHVATQLFGSRGFTATNGSTSAFRYTTSPAAAPVHVASNGVAAEMRTGASVTRAGSATGGGAGIGNGRGRCRRGRSGRRRHRRTRTAPRPKRSRMRRAGVVRSCLHSGVGMRGLCKGAVMTGSACDGFANPRRESADCGDGFRRTAAGARAAARSRRPRAASRARAQRLSTCARGHARKRSLPRIRVRTPLTKVNGPLPALRSLTFACSSLCGGAREGRFGYAGAVPMRFAAAALSLSHVF